MSAAEEVVEGTGTELVPAAAPPPSLFRTDDPVEVIERATAVADALKKVVADRQLISVIQRKEYPLVEAWQTLGAMLGVTAVVEWTRPLDNGWEARVVAQTLDGRIIGAAEAQCTKDERTWKSRDGYALRSMAQTRATSKALRGPLGFVMALAGYEATPAEEMPAEPAPQQPPQDAPAPVQGEALAGLLAVAKEAIDAGACTKQRLMTHAVAAGATDTSAVSKALGSLTPEAASALQVTLADMLDAKAAA